MTEKSQVKKAQITKDDFKQEVLNDYRVAFESRHASLIGRKEVLTGKAKFGIFGDGKEVAQLAMAKVFQKGDFRSGYYRDQTFMLSRGMLTMDEFFAQLYADPSVENDPNSAGRQMNAHFGTRLLNENGEWVSQTDNYNTASDISCTAGQMSRLVGLAWASKLYRNNPELSDMTDFSKNGDEIAFGTIGNASTSEGVFWEAINAAGVLRIPMLMSIWDDEYGISVPAYHQTTKENLTSILSGFQTDKDGAGFEMFKVKGWDYPNLIKTYAKAAEICRTKHTPVIIHVTEVTQPQGHSTSGSHERYKTSERLEWEKDRDCLPRMKAWMIKGEIASAEEIEALENESLESLKKVKQNSWKKFQDPIKVEYTEASNLLTSLAAGSTNAAKLNAIVTKLSRQTVYERKEIGEAIVAGLRSTIGEVSVERDALKAYYAKYRQDNYNRYNTYLHTDSDEAALKVAAVPAVYTANSESKPGYQILNKYFDAVLGRDPRVMAFGEDVGNIGDVNQGLAGLQAKYGDLRVMDMGIRENTIIGQAMGASMRGLKPIAEIQYLDYLLYALQIMSDDIASLSYRTAGGQKAPVIIRTRGHRLEGIWHSGSPMGMILNSIRGMHLCVPRSMTQAAGFYNTLLKSDEPGVVIECLNGYRLKETEPDNIEEFSLALGVPEVLKEGSDVTLVTYGSCVRIAEEAIEQLEETGISVELVDVQSLLPFDVNKMIVESLKKTNKVVFLDEDVPGGATAYMLQQVLEKQGGYLYLDSAPKTISARPHRPAYGSDGDYFSKPNSEDIFQAIYNMMNEYDPEEYQSLI
jgi:pyruvate/2-oxoglutarate/acetoin dehydrogenase E1 component/TPP-dependent pyruvate/acetoin dehydrogenase alpha subunit